MSAADHCGNTPACTSKCGLPLKVSNSASGCWFILEKILPPATPPRWSVNALGREYMRAAEVKDEIGMKALK